MRAREGALVALLAVGIVCLPLAAYAQRTQKVPRVGVLSPFAASSDAFLGRR